jgi:hypothetical protein
VRRSLLPALLLLACNPAPADADASASSSSDTSSDTSSSDTTSNTTTAPTDSTTDPVADTHDTDLGPVEFQCQPGAIPSDPFIDCIESFTPEGAVFGQDRLPEVVYGPPVADPASMGSLDVLSLGCGGEITLYFDEPAIVDGPGPDFIVFENPIPVGMSTFAEPARVLVSADGLEWHAFPCDPIDDKTLAGCAGVATVHADDMIDPTDPALAGGDAFDLAALGLSTVRYVRLLDVGVAYYGGRMWCGGGGGGFDLDAIAVVHGA